MCKAEVDVNDHEESSWENLETWWRWWCAVELHAWDGSAYITITGTVETENGIHMFGMVKWTQTETETQRLLLKNTTDAGTPVVCCPIHHETVSKGSYKKSPKGLPNGLARFACRTLHPSIFCNRPLDPTIDTSHFSLFLFAQKTDKRQQCRSTRHGKKPSTLHACRFGDSEGRLLVRSVARTWLEKKRGKFHLSHLSPTVVDIIPPQSCGHRRVCDTVSTSASLLNFVGHVRYPFPLG